ncbi:hypothetical protein [Flavobacterium sp. Root186]|uniref:hypothetical protein n=1 Tax=Flavobacterium sp. Root186 TaxID=1736485 RepID=UPI0006FDA1ED|nr:hypothetical protein [Flavobacterium sp. Root186]KRB56732.1 hypothetical protein ASD98_08555 [Flavobacterium sp. Root186]
MNTNHNRIKVVDLETNEPNKILKTNLKGELEFSDAENNFQPKLDDANFGAFQNSLQTISTIADTDKMPFLIGSLARMMTWANFKSLFKTVGGNSIFGSGNIATPDMDTTTAQTVSGVKIFLNLMLGLRNAANTFTSFITNTATASRTWTFPDKSGTVAMTSDITSVINAGTTNRIPKYVGSTVVGNSRILDDGTYIGIDNQWALSSDLLFGYLPASRTIGIEDSISIQNGKDLIVRAGRAINFNPSGGALVPLGQTYRQWRNMSCNNLTNDVFACANGFGVFKQTGGAGNFEFLERSNRQWYGVTVIPSSGDVYACVYNGDIYKQTGGIGSFVALGQTKRNWTAMGYNSLTENVYACADGGGIFIQTKGTGEFVSLDVSSLAWFGLAVNSSNSDVYACVNGGDIYKQTGGTGSFTALGLTSRSYRGMAINSTNNDVYACAGGDTYKQNGGTGNFVAMGYNYTFRGITINQSIGDIYATVESNDIYYKQNNDLGSPNLDGGTYKIKSGTGKGTGKSRVEFYTGQKTVSGTDMQVEKMRVYLDENGYFVYLTPPSYANDTDADADSNLPSKAFYKIAGSRALFQKP